MKTKCYLLLLWMWIFIVASQLSACASSNRTIQQVMAKYAVSSRASLQPYFTKAHVKYPSKRLSILIFKRQKVMQLYALQDSSWHYIKSFPILAASGLVGPKLYQGDHQVPEGIYKIIALNPNSQFDLSMQLDYPNRFDLQHAKLSGRRDVGDDIFIHGDMRSVGCIAIGNEAIEQLFPLIAEVGINNVAVVIAPVDLRKYAPIYSHIKPKWLPQLYRTIRAQLTHYSLPS